MNSNHSAVSTISTSNVLSSEKTELSVGSAYISMNLPFDCEKSWFLAVETGLPPITSDCELKVNVLVRSPMNISSPMASDTVDSEMNYDDEIVKRPQFSIIPPEPRFNRISGFLSRQQRQSTRMSVAAPVQIQQLLESASSASGSRYFQSCVFFFIFFLFS